MRFWGAVLGALLALTGCAVSGTAVADTSEFTLGEPFSIRGGDESTNPESGLVLRFADVLEDSRCPTEVECFWTGQARILVEAQPAGGDATSIEFNTNPAPGENAQSARVGDYTVTLETLDPYPETPEDDPVLDEYEATLLVTAP